MDKKIFKTKYLEILDLIDIIPVLFGYKIHVLLEGFLFSSGNLYS